MSEPTCAIAYLRCSTSRQDLSPEAQREAIRTWAKRNDVVVVAWHFDSGVSGGAAFEKRPELVAAIDSVRREGASLLVVAKRDRLARDVLTAALVERLCERHGARVQSADGTGNGDGPEAQLLRGVIDVFAQYERAIIRSRTKAALAVKKANGERVGGVPYGYRLEDGRVVEDADEQATVARARELRAAGLSLRRIGRVLIAEARNPRDAKCWHVQVVKRMVGGRRENTARACRTDY